MRRALLTPAVYQTERELGVAMQESGVPREKLFITTKAFDGLDDVESALKASLKKLQTDYVDLCALPPAPMLG